MDASLFTRPNKPDQMTVKQRTTGFFINPAIAAQITRKQIAVDSSTECHVTPCNEAAFMANAFGDIENKTFLEPHAGTGALIKALLGEGVKPEQITGIEKHADLYSLTASAHPDITMIRSCIFGYLATSNKQYDHMIANPPFKQIKKHMAACYQLLKKGGEMVALVPSTYEHPQAQTLKKLDGNTFAHTKVNTKIILITK